jgi:DNA-binding transcriptional ArsR family regulator
MMELLPPAVGIAEITGRTNSQRRPDRSILRELAGIPDWTRACGTFDLPVTKATRSHHFTVLRAAGLIEQRDAGPRRLNRLRRKEFDTEFPGLLPLILQKR